MDEDRDGNAVPVLPSDFRAAAPLVKSGGKHFSDIDLHFSPANKWAGETADCSPIASLGVIYFLIPFLLVLAGQE